MIVLAADHAGFRLKERIRDYLAEKGYEVEDLGAHSEDLVDYPDFAMQVAVRVSNGRARFGVLVCGTGLGMAMTANKFPGVRAAACSDTLGARLSREHNDANVLALGGRTLDGATACKILDVWLATPFAGGRHQRRVEKIRQLEKEDFRERSQ